MLFQNTGIPDTLPYLFLGLAVFFVIVPGWIVSVFWRNRKLRQEKAMLEQLLAEDGAPSISGPVADTGAANTPNARPT